MSLFMFLVMAALGVVALVMLKKQNRAGAVVCLVLVVLLAIGRLVSSSWSGTAGERNIQKARQVITDGLAQKVSERYPRGKVVILGVRETPNMNWMNAAYLETQNQLEKACKKRNLEVEILPYRSGPEKNDLVRIEREALIAEGLLNAESAEKFAEPEIVTAKPLTRRLYELKDRADVVIMVLPLSPGFAARDLPAKDTAPHLVVMAAPPWDDLETVMETTVLDTVFMFRGDSSKLVLKKWPRDDAKAFDERYYFLTARTRGPQGLLSSGN